MENWKVWVDTKEMNNNTIINFREKIKKGDKQYTTRLGRYPQSLISLWHQPNWRSRILSTKSDSGTDEAFWVWFLST